MPDAIITLPDGRRARLSGPSRAAIVEQAQQLAAGGSAAPRSTGDFGLDVVTEMMRRGPTPNVERAERYPLSLGPFGSVNVGGPVAGLLNDINNSGEAATPIVLGTLGSLGAGPIMTGAAAAARVAPLLSRVPWAARTALGPLARTGIRFGPATAGAAAGGGLGGGLLEAQDPNSTPASIATAASRSAREMAMAEMLGLGIGTTAAGAFAPMTTSLLGRAAPFFDKMKAGREAVSSWLRRAPAEARHVAVELAQRFPDEVAAARAATERLRDLVARTTLVREGLEVTSNQKLREVWDSLAGSSRTALGSFERFAAGMRQVAKVANSEVGREALESAAVPLATMAFGPGAGALLWGIRQVVAPGPLARWFQNSTLPSVTTQTLGGQAVKTAARAGLLSGPEEDDTYP